MKAGIFVNAASTISHQPTFAARGFAAGVQPLGEGHELLQPVYKEYIDPTLLRRMSRILRMGVACSVDCLRQVGVELPEGIIVGTGLGCLQDTEKFLQNFLTLEGLIPPTSFILSTHNTVAGQISLTLGCHAYNITHTQNTLSFEVALLDGILKLEEGANNILVGSADEYIPFLAKVAEAWGYRNLPLVSGASFFILSREVSERTLAEVVDLSVEHHDPASVYDKISTFLDKNSLTMEEIALILGSDSAMSDNVGSKGDFVNYLSLSGLYPTASAFAFHYGLDFLASCTDKKHVLVVNELSAGKLGLVLLKSVEA